MNKKRGPKPKPKFAKSKRKMISLPPLMFHFLNTQIPSSGYVQELLEKDKKYQLFVAANKF